jgi:hypothetical protein
VLWKERCGTRLTVVRRERYTSGKLVMRRGGDQDPARACDSGRVKKKMEKHASGKN